MIGPATVFFFWLILLNPEPGHIGGPGENHFYPDAESCEQVRATIEHVNKEISGFRIAPKCIELDRTNDR